MLHFMQILSSTLLFMISHTLTLNVSLFHSTITCTVWRQFILTSRNLAQYILKFTFPKNEFRLNRSVDIVS